jgi:hypothetical protein
MRASMRAHELHFLSEKTRFHFSRGRISASSRRADGAARSLPRADRAAAEPKICLQNG